MQHKYTLDGLEIIMKLHPRLKAEHPHLTVSAAYVAMLVSNERVSHWLNERHPDFAVKFEIISKEARDARAASNSSDPRSKSFQRVRGDAAPPLR